MESIALREKTSFEKIKDDLTAEVRGLTRELDETKGWKEFGVKDGNSCDLTLNGLYFYICVCLYMHVLICVTRESFVLNCACDSSIVFFVSSLYFSVLCSCVYLNV